VRNQATGSIEETLQAARPVRASRWVRLSVGQEAQREDDAGHRRQAERVKRATRIRVAGCNLDCATNGRLGQRLTPGSRGHQTPRRGPRSLSLQIIPLSRSAGNTTAQRNVPSSQDLRAARLPRQGLCHLPTRVSMPSCNHRKRHCRPPRQLRFRLGPPATSIAPAGPRELGWACRDSCSHSSWLYPGCLSWSAGSWASRHWGRRIGWWGGRPSCAGSGHAGTIRARAGRQPAEVGHGAIPLAWCRFDRAGLWAGRISNHGDQRPMPGCMKVLSVEGGRRQARACLYDDAVEQFKAID